MAATVTGVGWLALLPPFEGFDETAHYSYLQQLADTGRKALFLPLALAVALFLLIRRQGRALAITLFVAAIVAAPWYAHAHATAGVTSGSLEHRLFVEQDGLSLLSERISLAAVVRGVAATLASFVWAGTWSLARPPESRRHRTRELKGGGQLTPPRSVY